MIKLKVNNQGTMQIYQNATGVQIEVIRDNKIDTDIAIDDADFVTLINYYKYQKENNLPIF